MCINNNSNFMTIYIEHKNKFYQLLLILVEDMVFQVILTKVLCTIIIVIEGRK